MRRSKQSETAPATSSAPPLTPAALPRARATNDSVPEVLGVDDLERGRSAALLASLGRVQLTLDIIERRLGRLEETVASLQSTLEEVPAQTSALLVITANELDADAEADTDAEADVIDEGATATTEDELADVDSDVAETDVASAETPEETAGATGTEIVDPVGLGG